eukprot:4337866-Prymnesium_polylepis.2
MTRPYPALSLTDRAASRHSHGSSCDSAGSRGAAVEARGCLVAFRGQSRSTRCQNGRRSKSMVELYLSIRLS